VVLFRRELEASSCVFDDNFTIRYTLSKQQQATKWCPFSQPKKKLAVLEPQVAMSGSHMLTIGGFFNLKAVLQNRECTYSTHFVVAGCRWYFQFNPAGVIGLVRVSDDMTPTTAEFSFELEGVVNFKSERMTHTFEGMNSRYLYRHMLEPSTSAMHDHHIVRCCLAIMKVELPSLPRIASPPIATTPTVMKVELPSLPRVASPLLATTPSVMKVELPSLPRVASPPIAATPHTGLLLTPLLRAMYD
jgi:hypothetical protein